MRYLTPKEQDALNRALRASTETVAVGVPVAPMTTYTPSEAEVEAAREKVIAAAKERQRAYKTGNADLCDKAESDLRQAVDDLVIAVSRPTPPAASTGRG